ncbi:MAG: prepilin-type N-terminal cleavage/methylation domain-containing protein [Candidatus Caldatribacteriota bacterium]
MLQKLNKKLSRNQKGFSLIELMVAVAILGTAALGIFQAYQVGFWGMSDARARTIATNIAREKLEEVKGKSLIAGTYPDPENPIHVSGKEFKVIVEVEDVIEGGQTTTLKKIITTVEWQKRNGEPTNISVESLQSKALAPPNTDTPTAILLSANPGEIEIGEQSLLKVTILDQDNYPISYSGQINLERDPDTDTLSTLDDYFLIFSEESFLFTNLNANSEGNAGNVQITARDDLNELIPDSETITITGGEPENISITADPDSILINGETSTLTIRIEDENGFLAENWTGTIKLEIASGQDTGNLGDPPFGNTITIEFNEENEKTTLFTSTTKDGEALIKASDQDGELNSDNAIIFVSSGPPYQIDIEAEPKNIMIEEESIITVTIENETDAPVFGFEGTVSLTLLSGFGSGSLTVDSLTFNGESSLTTTFTATTTPGIVEIEALDTTSAEPLVSDTETITVAIGPPDTIEITASPDMILNDGSETSTLTIALKDSGGNYSSFEEDKNLTFTLNPDEGTVNNLPLMLPAGHSQVSTTYLCNNEDFDGDVEITVTCEGVAEVASAIVQVVSRMIKPSEEPNIRYGQRRWWFWWIEDRSKVLFDIEVIGGTIDISQIDLAWKEGTTSEELSGITIYEKDNSSNIRIRKTWNSYNEPLVPIYPDLLEITSFDTNQRLEVGEYTVELDYDRNVTNRTILIQFHGNYEGKMYIYQMEFLSPDLIV